MTRCARTGNHKCICVEIVARRRHAFTLGWAARHHVTAGQSRQSEWNWTSDWESSDLITLPACRSLNERIRSYRSLVRCGVHSKIIICVAKCISDSEFPGTNESTVYRNSTRHWATYSVCQHGASNGDAMPSSL